MTTPEIGNLGDIFRAHAGAARTAVVDLSEPERPREISFAELDARCDAVAGGLYAQGLEPGDRVGILALNRVEFLEALFGAMRAGCVPVMINAKLPAETVRYIVRDSGAKLVFCDPDLAPLCPAGTWTVRFGGGGDSYEAFLSPGRFKSFAPGPEDVAEQPYTSGSTGRPKGVLLTHAGQVWMNGRIVASRGMRGEDCSVISAPLYHKNALLAVKSALAPGGRVVLFASFDARQYIEAIGRRGITILTGVPTMYALILQQRELLARTDTGSVRAISMGSAPASDALLDALAEAFPGVGIYLNYGITEGGPILFSWFHPEGKKRPRTSVGTPIEGVEIRLLGGETPDEGVLHVKSPGVTIGYHNNPEETAARLREGWFDTGDILRRDADGWYYFVDRADDMFVCAGENVYPGAVEAMLERHPGIAQAAVVKAPDALKAYLPYAFVVPRAGASLDEAAVKRWALDHGPAFAHPRRVFFVETLPLSGTNKIDRRALERRAAEAAAGAA